MYIRTRENFGFGLGFGDPPKSKLPEFRKKFTSKVIAYKNASDKCQTTDCSVFVPAGRDLKQLDLMIFFHGLLDVCDSAHGFDPDNVIRKFKMDSQVENESQLALVVPIVMWNKSDRVYGVIRSAWSAAYLNAFVEEVLDQIGKFYSTGPNLGRLILSGHSAGYDILTPLADQFDCDVAETNKGALAKLGRVLGMDTMYRTKDAQSFDQWARKRPGVKFDLLLSKSDPSVAVWQDWEKKTRKRLTGTDKRPANMRVFHQTTFKHCEMPANFLVTYLDS